MSEFSLGKVAFSHVTGFTAGKFTKANFMVQWLRTI